MKKSRKVYDHQKFLKMLRKHNNKQLVHRFRIVHRMKLESIKVCKAYDILKHIKIDY